MGAAIQSIIKGYRDIADGPGHEAVIFGLIIALLAIIVGHLMAFFQFKARLNDKDERIKDLVEERNKFQHIVLKGKGISRKSSQE